MNYLHSNLEFDFNDIENFIEEDVPEEIYRYFDNESDRENFINGNVWFCGPSKNQFFSPVSDSLEYRNHYGSYAHEYSLSCSTEIIDETKPNVMIKNPVEFIREIISTIKSKKILHQISWFALEALRSHPIAKSVPIVRAIQRFPEKENETLLLHLVGIGGRRLKYVEKITEASIKARGGFKYDSVEAALNARDHNEDFSDEMEFRVHINTGDFLSGYSGNGLLHLVQYIKLYCPGIKKYCICL